MADSRFYDNRGPFTLAEICAKAGIAVNEVIASVAGKPTPTVDDLSAVLAGLKPGQATKVELVTPEGAKRTVSVTLGQLPGS